MGREEGCVTHFESLRYRLQAFVSTILKQLNKPPFLPQLCSISSKLVITHTMTPRPTVIGTQGYRRGLASLSVVKELLFRVYRNALIGRIAANPNSVQDVSGGTYSFALRELAFQLGLPQLPLSFCFVF